MGKGITYSTSGKDCPCCGCQERAVGCHGKGREAASREAGEIQKDKHTA